MAGEGRPRSYHTVAVNIQWVVNTGMLKLCTIQFMDLIFTLTRSCQVFFGQVCSFRIMSNSLNSTQLDSEDVPEQNKWTVAE